MKWISILLILLFLPFADSYARNTPEKFKSRAVAYFQAGMYERAVEEFSKAIELGPDYELYILRGKANLAKKDFDNAISDFTAASEIFPNDITAYSERGKAYAAKGWFAQALYDLNRSIGMKPDDGLSYYYRADVYYAAGDYKMAWADLKKARMLGQLVSDALLEDFQKKALSGPDKKGFFSVFEPRK